MNFGGPPKPPKGDVPPPDAEPQLQTKSAAPPPCPRCNLTKQQCAKTVLNYQRSHYKKVQALRQELKSARQQVDSLNGQLRGYRATAKALPVVGLVALAVWFIRRRQRRGPNPPEPAPGFRMDPPTAPGTPGVEES